MGLFDGVPKKVAETPRATAAQTAISGMEVAERQLENAAAWQPILTPGGAELLRRARESRPLDDRAKAAFLEALASLPNEHRAALAAGVTMPEARKAKREDPAFAEAWDMAIHLAAGYAEAEAWRRGVEGVTQGVYHQGIKIDTKQEYSDSLLTRILESNVPRYERRSHVETTGQINLNWLDLVKAVHGER